ncbi:MAG: hypothetical protein ACK52K_13415 [Alphaproteobacteria bacterium]|jgi:hypothetical protein
MAQLFWLSGQQLSDGNGAPHIAAKAWFYETGTTTPKATYSDAGLTSVNANPVVADANGRFGDIYLVAGRYRVVLTTSADVAIDTLDPVDGTSQIISVASAPATAYPFLRYHNTTDGNVYRRNAANSAWINEGGVDSLINAASVSEVLTGTEATKAVTPDALAGLWQRGTDLASASTLSLPATGGGVFTVTGTTTVTGISTGSGGRRITLRFAGSLTLTHSANFILPGGVNITTVAGDVAEFINDAAQDATGSNWRCVSYQRASGVSARSVALPLVTATGNYGATTANAGGFIYFGSLSATATLTLPSAASMVGQSITVVNSSTDFAVIIDPNGSETLDGATTRQTFGMARVTIISDGGQWLTVQGRYLFFSGDQTVSAGALYSQPHGLGARPQFISVEYRCITTEHNWAAGDIIYIGTYDNNGGSTLGCNLYADATNLSARWQNTSTPLIALTNKTTGAGGATLTNANWRYRFYAEAY